MKSLFDYDILVHDVFYRTHHILEYIRLHPNMDDLDKKAISATIMDALVSEKLINPKEEALDFYNLSIVKSKDDKYYHYEKNPFVMGIPYNIKKLARKKGVVASGGLPISFLIGKPTQKDENLRYCIYDANIAFSSLFLNHTLYKGSYISPTRKNKIVEERPFVEVNHNGIPYLVDILTKRYYRTDMFRGIYAFKINSIKVSTNYNSFEKEYYHEQVKNSISFDTYISIINLKKDKLINNPKYAELFYEIEKSKEIFPDEWKKVSEFKERHNDVLLMSCDDGIVLKKTP